ncbi:MAG: aldehyde dehydrogenase family protein [Actinomyces sp.]|nr:MAG: aldehyde dehydrogenase family protein [Actinomyces sp.]
MPDSSPAPRPAPTPPPVAKTYKLFIGGSFPRSESGRSYPVRRPDGSLVANVARASRKDLRDAVKAATGAQSAWAGRTAYNRGQILYRVAEVLEGRRAQFVDELVAIGVPGDEAAAEVEATVDAWVWYAGWADKYPMVLGTVNPVAGPYFDFTVPEPTGVVGIFSPRRPALLGLVERLAPVIVSGNTAVVVVPDDAGPVAVDLAEVLATSDLPGGVVDILTGFPDELAPWMLGHRGVNAVDLTGAGELAPELVAEAAVNVKRVVRGHPGARGPEVIADFVEYKTVWHPIGR